MSSPRTSATASRTGRPAASQPVRAAAASEAAQEARAGGDGKSRRAPRRDAFFDNAKYLAIVLVAVGHAWEPLRDDSRAVSALYMLVYAFHMPAFIVIAGHHSRGFDGSEGRVKRLLTGVALPYVVFETAYTLFTRWTDGVPDRPVTLLEPLYLTWFLAALFVWRLTTPLWKLVRWPVPLALVVAMAASLSPSLGEDLDVQRTLQFLPYFVLGLFLRPEHFRAVRRRRVRVLAVPVFAVALAVAYWAVPRVTSAWLHHGDSAQELSAPAWYGPVVTLVLFASSLLLVACFLAWVPGRRTWFTALGAATLYGYLLHGFVAQVSKYWGWYEPGWLHRPLGAVVVTLVAAVVVTALCTAPVRRVFRWVVEPKPDWAFRRPVTERT
ncbi:acyltransferase family protein [Streptomyces griseomycini]|uniref:Fucose 4-O-acetylase-like acetyltransferase n=1 Tax=Streptomyces griseomycini TaxID=66895 RepID=A0A7W7LZS0_9ACTN|nr:acyltransferase family protein [Streptomyces griseomycini]MBB4899032.1 fucose 4-O-acetylase-like acetyltransferase [Streptomyces griseomycini]GGQ06489.1 membrane protein [Streptomyces griseomycini]GGR21761.1 membrane protein [Streptomyces griseomycini]